MKSITLKTVQNYFIDNDMLPRHNLTAIRQAINKLNKEAKIDSYELFLLIVENKEIQALHTHSYGFHTANGRYLINTFTNYYNDYFFNINK